jgi:hypothetical protein
MIQYIIKIGTDNYKVNNNTFIIALFFSPIFN